MKPTNFLTLIALAAALLFSACNKTEPENPNQTEENSEGTLTVAMYLTDGLAEPSSLTFYIFDSEGTALREDYNDYSTSYSFTLSPETYTVVAVANVDSWLPTADEAATLGIDGLVDALIELRDTDSDMLTGHTEATVVANETETVVLTLKNGVFGLPGAAGTLTVTVNLADGLTEPSSLTLYLFESDGTAYRKDYSDYSTVVSDSYTLLAGTATVVAVANVDDELPTEDEATTLGIDGLVDSLIVLRGTATSTDMLTAYTEATVVADDTQIVTLTLQSGSSGLPGKGTVIVYWNIRNLDFTLAMTWGTYIFASDGTVHYNYYGPTDMPENIPFYNVPSGPATVVYKFNVDSSEFPTADEAKEMGIYALAEYLLTLEANRYGESAGYGKFSVEPNVTNEPVFYPEDGTSSLEELVN